MTDPTIQLDSLFVQSNNNAAAAGENEQQVKKRRGRKKKEPSETPIPPPVAVDTDNTNVAIDNVAIDNVAIDNVAIDNVAAVNVPEDVAEEVPEEVPKRKRGRPAKVLSSEKKTTDVSGDPDMLSKTVSGESDDAVIPQKKRGRKPSNMKSYGINQDPFKTKEAYKKADQKEEKIILHLPVKRQKLKTIENKMFRHETRLEQPMPMLDDNKAGGSKFVGAEVFDDIQNCPNVGTKDACYMISGGIVKCIDCRKMYNGDIDKYNSDIDNGDIGKCSDKHSTTNVDVVKVTEKRREKEYQGFIKNKEQLPKSFKDSPIVNTDNRAPKYDPEDIYDVDGTSSDDVANDSDELEAPTTSTLASNPDATSRENAEHAQLRNVIRPTSHLNPQIDEQAPSREQYEYLKEEYQHMRQKYRDLKSKYDSYSQIVDVVKEDNKGVVTDAPMHSTTVYTLMKSFRESERWPQRTQVFCWWDSHPFTTMPIAIPTSYNQVNQSFCVYGCFCSFQCALAYKKYDRNLDSVDTSLLYFFFNKITNNKVNLSNLKPAPPRQMLSIFGGSLSIDQYRDFAKDRNLTYDMITYPLIPVAQYAEIQKKKDPESIKMSQLSRPKLKLKRTKPLPHHKNMLENSMGLNVTTKVKTI